MRFRWALRIHELSSFRTTINSISPWNNLCNVLIFILRLCYVITDLRKIISSKTRSTTRWIHESSINWYRNEKRPLILLLSDDSRLQTFSCKLAGYQNAFAKNVNIFHTKGTCKTQTPFHGPKLIPEVGIVIGFTPIFTIKKHLLYFFNQFLTFNKITGLY